MRSAQAAKNLFSVTGRVRALLYVTSGSYIYTVHPCEQKTLL